MMEMVSRAHARQLVEWARNHPAALVLSADLTGSCEADLFRDTFPERFISCGIAEQNMLSVAGGLCREGFVPLVHTFAVFICRRAFDQIAMSVAYPNQPVKMFGFLPGLTTPGGATHQAIDDIALMRSLPNMTVFEVGDATEVESVLDVAWEVSGPVYVRMLRGDVPRLFPADEPMRLSIPRVPMLGSDVAVVTSGICTEEAMRATAVMARRGVSITHVHISTLKPFEPAGLDELLATGAKGIVTMENHLIDGGLGSAVVQYCSDKGLSRPVVRLGIRDRYSHGASRPHLMREHGIDAMSLVDAISGLLGADLGIQAGDLAAVRVEPVHSIAKAEAL